MRFTAGLSPDDFKTSELVQSAVIREFQVMGEAARMVTAETVQSYDQIPWVVVRGMRNRLVHEYFDIRVDVLWDTVKQNIPGLLAQLEKIVAAEENQDNES